MSKAWRVVDHHQEDLPMLLSRERIDDKGYTFYLTDLAYLWTETLDKAALLERAKELRCSIDPSQDAEQFGIFLDKLKSAFRQEHGTSLELKSRRTGSDITIGITVNLPNPLPALEWELQLQRNDGLIASELTKPMISHAYGLQQHVRDLIRELQAKDHVISRLTDRMETTGTPLAEVFPNVANLGAGRSKAISKAKLAQHVPGLLAFDEVKWSSQIRSSAIEKVSNAMLLVVVDALPVQTMELPTKDWWRGLNATITSTEPVAKVAVLDESESTPEAEDTTVFETHADHNAAESSSVTEEVSKPSTSARSTTQHLPIPSSQLGNESAPKSKPKKLGAIGGGKLNVNSVTPPTAGDGDTASDTTHASETQIQPVSNKTKLGSIGGRKAIASKEETLTSTLTDPPAIASRPRKLGAIGGKKHDTAAASDNSGSTTATRDKLQRPSTVIGDTATKQEVAGLELADQKRDQLKRQLEQQAKAPVKKKRKF